MLRRETANVFDLAPIQQLFKFTPRPLFSDQQMFGEWDLIVVVTAYRLIAVELQPVAQLAFGVKDRDLPSVSINSLQVLRHRARRVKVIDRWPVNAQEHTHDDE